MKFDSKTLRETWLKFYESKGHVNIGAVSLIGDGTTGVMFNVAGMQPLMPYLLGEKHPQGTRLCNIQGCVRTIDIDSVGDESHFTFFEMMGNWSLGDYFKKEKTAWTFELLTQKLGFDKDKICASVFAGDETAPRDEETAELLLNLGVKKENIFFLPKKDNWWELEGTTGTPCGPDNEWFYPRNDNKCSENCDITCDCGRYVEIGNDVYMQYEKTADGYKPLSNKNVDTGFGFERLLMFLNGLTDGYKIDIFKGVISILENASGIKYGENVESTKAMRIIADHLRTATMLIGDVNGILPSNVGSGYILRRLMRRAIRYARKINVGTESLLAIVKEYIENIYGEAYPLLVEKKDYIVSEVNKEIDKFNKTIEAGTKEFEKVVNGINRKNQFMKMTNPDFVEETEIGGKAAFRLFDTFGFPLEMTIEMASEIGFTVDVAGYEQAFKEHQELARSTSAGAFKGGLADDSAETVRLHTACHLTLAGLRKMFGTHIEQKGSNITPERLRFDFNFDRKLTDEEVKELEDFVNNAIKREIPVERLEMTFKDAKAQGGYGIHKADENENVSIYKIGDVDFQICGGPHVANTNELGTFKISKQEAVSAGVRRFKATLN
ncbi:MAG: alanine--tRNA ligase [Clostridia bacterium]|nr:alanine--tRNA ligase [Clostridia bacterium]